MIEFCSLYSGSSGNCLFVRSNKTNILIDAGVSLKKIINGLKQINVTPEEIDCILVTHEHTDHVLSLGSMSRKYNLPVYCNEKTWSVLENQKDKMSNNNIKYYDKNSFFSIGDIDVMPFSIPHDSIDPCGFNLFNDNTKISIATDLGHITHDIMNNLKESSFLMLESNYDPNLLKICSYPFILKRRIQSPTGHLPNNIAGKVISDLADFGLKRAMLGHLSCESNIPELAYKTVIDELLLKNITSDLLSVNVASRMSPSELVKIS